MRKLAESLLINLPPPCLRSPILLFSACWPGAASGKTKRASACGKAGLGEGSAAAAGDSDDDAYYGMTATGRCRMSQRDKPEEEGRYSERPVRGLLIAHMIVTLYCGCW